MKELLCRAFCEALDIRKVPAGFALRTPYVTSDGDSLLIYFVRADDGRWRLEDDGTQVPMLEANGVDLSKGTRLGAFQSLLKEYGAHFDRKERTIRTPLMVEAETGKAALAFSALLLRLQDLALLTAPIVRNAFREDALAAIHKAFDGRAVVEDKGALAEEMIGSGGDIIVRAPERPPLSIFIGTSEERALHALVTKMDAEKYAFVHATVVLLLERVRQNPVSDRTLGLAQARLDRVLSFRESEPDAIFGLVKLAGLSPELGVFQ